MNSLVSTIDSRGQLTKYIAKRSGENKTNLSGCVKLFRMNYVNLNKIVLD
jgi:hypothetical protein